MNQQPIDTTPLGAEVILLLPILLLVYAYLLYPALMWVIARRRKMTVPFSDTDNWPQISIVLPVYNEERTVGATLESLLALEYPEERRHIIVVSDASTDRTDAIVEQFLDRGIELVRMPVRGGKTTAENAASSRIRGAIIVNTDASVRILPGSLKALVRVFQDADIGLASGRDVSVGDVSREGTRGESGYVGYEMWLRSLETRAGSIVGASGCFFAIRRELFDVLFPSSLSRDFASALITVDRGFRAVSVDQAVCLVPRTPSLRAEYRRKVRTMTRGLETLWYKRGVLQRCGFLFGLQVVSHKLIRWLVFLPAPLVPLGFWLLAKNHSWARASLEAVAFGALLALLAFFWPARHRPPRPLALFGFVYSSVVAGFVAWIRALRGELEPVWEPTRRPTLPPEGATQH